MTNEITNCHKNIQRCRSSLFTLIVAAVGNVNIESVTIVDQRGTVQFVKLYLLIVVYEICILSMKYGLNALRDFMDFIPTFCRTQNVAQKYFIEFLHV